MSGGLHHDFSWWDRIEAALMYAGNLIAAWLMSPGTVPNEPEWNMDAVEADPSLKSKLPEFHVSCVSLLVSDNVSLQEAKSSEPGATRTCKWCRRIKLGIFYGFMTCAFIAGTQLETLLYYNSLDEVCLWWVCDTDSLSDQSAGTMGLLSW
eukprot:Blabericola_migrator_1__220@NODE_1058_length_5569_cov_7_008179_g728_i0_p4_GENE_NODE_1058_length_5569_cov_7_008179_g728_i0NODE_1058_length_5569_cov_7_008179_g728_i0_p4_ORF_typecomplete_len151_score17_52C1_2/PF03107_16/0_25_NODE_1058_length_5569_cov_7_008179_g728_i036104062